MFQLLFGRKSASTRLARSPFAKLRLETLEARDVPAVTVVSMGDVTEGGADGAFAFHRAGSTASELTIQFTVSGSATAGDDYTGPSYYNSLTFSEGQSDATVAVHPIADAFVEGTETLTIVVGSGSTATMQILDTLAGRQLVWEGVNLAHFGDASNWSDRVDPMAHYTPTSADDLYFVGGSPGRNADCVYPYGLPVIKGLHLIEGYTGTVTTPDNLGVGTLELTSGNILQSYAYDGMNDLFITALLDFRGGTLNSGATLGTVHITGDGVGAAANLLPGAGALTIGSTISVEGLGTAGGGSTLGMFAGQYEFTNGSGFIIGEFCVQEVKLKDGWTINDPDKVTITNGGNKLKSIFFDVLEGGKLEYKAKVTAVDFAQITVRPKGFCGVYDVEVDLGRPSALNKLSLKVERAVNGDAGRFELRSSKGQGKLIAPGGILVDGEFATTFDADPAVSTDPTAIVWAEDVPPPGHEGEIVHTAEVTISAQGKLIVGDGAGFGKLVIGAGDLVVAGTIVFDIDCSGNSGRADEIIVRDAVKFSAGSKVDIEERNKAPGVAVALGRTWNVIQADQISFRPAGSAASNNAAYELTFYDNKKFDIKKI